MLWTGGAADVSEQGGAVGSVIFLRMLIVTNRDMVASR